MSAGLRGRLAALVPEGRIARGIITLASGTAMAQVITICAMPLVTRLYTPAQIGIISLFLAFFGFWSPTLSLRYEYALLIATDDAESHVVHRLAVALVVAMSVLGFPLLWGLQYSGVLGFGLLPYWAAFAITPTLLGYGIFMVYRSWALRAGMVASITKASIIRSAANAGTRVFLGLFGGFTLALFLAEVAGAYGAMFKLAKSVSDHFSSARPMTIGCEDLRRVARKYIKFPTFEAPSAWVDQLGSVLPVPMVAALHGPAAAGWFGLARLIAGVPNSQIGGAVADVFQMEFASAVAAGDFGIARGLFYKLLRKLALFGLPAFCLMAVLGPWAVPWIFGNSWSETGLAIAAISPWLFAALLISPLSRALSVLQAQEYKLIYDVCAVLFLAGAFLLAKSYDYPFIDTVLAISVAGLLGFVVYAVVLVAVVELRLKRVVV